MFLVLRNKVVVLMTMMMMVMTMSDGAVYKIGDSAGRTSIGLVDYEHWAASKNFHAGDTIIFQYNPQFHNVMRVTNQMYKSCNASAETPLETFSTGNDSIKLNNYGHHLFMCGFPGHCQRGQKIDINVIRVSAIKPPTPSGRDDQRPCLTKLPLS
ncbi:mavicyanin-like [Neltuma alba]|uniref:mavicyanin-like n=1 Tax=Neltuma alba TaxID=207710 RepID=UPI0010A3F537|nr:mavicyanin-like [Prosopis alba]